MAGPIVNIQDLGLRAVAIPDGTALKIVTTLKFPDNSTQITAAGSSQWVASATNIYNTNAGKVGIGIDPPSADYKFFITALLGSVGAALLTTNDFAAGVGSSLRLDFGAASGNTWSRISAMHSGENAYDNLILQGAAGYVGIGMVPTVQFEISGAVGQKASGTTWSNPSSRKLKKDIKPFRDGLDKILKIDPVWYTLNGLAGTPEGQRAVGIIGEEMRKVAPYTIEYYMAKLRKGDKKATRLVRFDANAMTYMIINALKELDARTKMDGYRKAA